VHPKNDNQFVDHENNHQMANSRIFHDGGDEKDDKNGVIS